MRVPLLGALVAMLALAGCGNEAEVARDRAQDARMAELDGKIEAVAARPAQADNSAALRAELQALQVRVAALENAPAQPVPADHSAALAELRKRLEALESSRKEVPATTAADTAPTPTQPETDVTAQVDGLLPQVRANPGDQNKLSELAGLLRKADKAARDKAISELRALVAEQPQSKEARLALAELLTTRFADLKNPMDQGRLASDVKKELDAALKIDPDYYDAVHFLAILKANYPTFTSEFQTAEKELLKAVELQAALTWEDRFADIYATWGMWYRVQGKLDEAGAKVQQGLDKAPRHEGLLAEKQRIEAARQAGG